MKEMRNDDARGQTTTIVIWRSTKVKLDKNRAPGQCYNGFICQLIDLWEKANEERVSIRTSPAGGNQGAVSSKTMA